MDPSNDGNEEYVRPPLAKQELNLTPSFAIESILGVVFFLQPKQLTASNRKQSTVMRTMFSTMYLAC